MCTSWSSVNQISYFKFSGFFRVLFALWSLKYPHPKSQQTPRVSKELEMLVNLSYSFILLQKILQKGVDHPVENPRKHAEISKWYRTRRTNSIVTFAGKCPYAAMHNFSSTWEATIIISLVSRSCCCGELSPLSISSSNAFTFSSSTS